MVKLPTAPSDPAPFSGDVPFPSAEFELLDGLHVSLRPDYGMTHSVMGVHYVLEAQDKEGQTAAIKITFSSRRRGLSDEPGPEFERYIELQPSRGKPLACMGKDYGFEFKALKSPSFVPRDNNYRISQAVPGGGFMIELDPFFLNNLRLFYEPPYKGRSEVDL